MLEPLQIIAALRTQEPVAWLHNVTAGTEGGA